VIAAFVHYYCRCDMSLGGSLRAALAPVRAWWLS
jgi:hypothetical protein